MERFIEIDGSHGEGGGQILRSTLALSAILGKPTQIKEIRKGRKKPGLAPQHLMGVSAVQAITSATVKGAKKGSTALVFEPKQLSPGKYDLDIGTAGSISLVLQAIIPPLIFCQSRSEISVIGGTHVVWSPCFHYMRDVFVPALEAMGAAISLEIGAWGWYPKGGGQVVAKIAPAAKLSALTRTARGPLTHLHVLSAASNLPSHVGQRQRDQAVKCLQGRGIEPRVEVVDAPSPGTGTVVFIKAEFEQSVAGFSALGERGKPAEKVADEACFAFFKFLDSQGAVDRHLADQLIIYMALAKGRSTLKVEEMTKHLLTNIWVTEQFLPVRFEVDEGQGTVSVEGVG